LSLSTIGTCPQSCTTGLSNISSYQSSFTANPRSRYKGWLNLDEISRDYENYARVVFGAIGDRVKYWLTFNEPVVITTLGYSIGVFAPGRSSDRSRCEEGDSSTEVSQNVVYCGFVLSWSFGDSLGSLDTRFSSRILWQSKPTGKSSRQKVLEERVSLE
jgi:hypothetical protein